MSPEYVYYYALMCSKIFTMSNIYLLFFLVNAVVPRTVDYPARTTTTAPILVNVSCILLFALQHSGMARRAFKRTISRLVPKPMERSTYVLASSASLGVLMWMWRPMPGVVWRVPKLVGYGAYALAWWLVIKAAAAIPEADLSGMKEARLYRQGGSSGGSVAFQTPFLYRYVRHPIYVGWGLMFWATPTMTEGRLLLAVGMSMYILVAIVLEERDLVHEHGEKYREYQRRVSKLIPGVF